eukprot:13009496-Alexandrium_andersonii.AAC.1
MQLGRLRVQFSLDRLHVHLSLAAGARSAPCACRARCPDDGPGDPRTSASRSHGFAILVAGVLARVPIAVVGMGLCIS